MFVPAVFFVAWLSAAAPNRQVRAEPPRYEQALKLFQDGDFDGALKSLETTSLDGVDNTAQVKMHLLRAQCLAAKQDFARAEEAFAQALDVNPEASLDPSRVDPTVVKLLESVRARLTGTVMVETRPAGASVFLDKSGVGISPQTLSIPPGKHQLEVRWGDGAPEAMEIQVRPRRELRVAWVQSAGTQSTNTLLEPRPIRPFGDLRGMVEPSPAGNVLGGLDLGGGFEASWFRVGLWARLYSLFGITPRFQLALPVVDKVNVVLEVSLPMTFLPSGFGLGIGGGGGAEYYPLPWLGAYILIGGRHHFLWPNRGDNTAFTATGGVRLRVP